MKQDIDLSSVAMFLGSALQHRMPRSNVMTSAHVHKPSSTISVEQYKEKFGAVRVYCTLADEDLIKQCFGTCTDELKMQRIGEDADYYRSCYMRMLDILGDRVPKHQITLQADYPELLFQRLDELEDWFVHNEKTLDFYCRRYSIPDINALKMFLYKVNRFETP